MPRSRRRTPCRAADATAFEDEARGAETSHGTTQQDKKPPVENAELKSRARLALHTQMAKDACKRMLRSLAKTAQIVVEKKGAVSGR